MKTFSLNDYVYFKVTEAGRAILHEAAEKFHQECPWVDIKYAPSPFRGRWYKEQLHRVMELFGGRQFVGCMLPITDLTFDEPPEDTP